MKKDLVNISRRITVIAYVSGLHAFEEGPWSTLICFFHRTLKVVYLEHKQNRRIDVLLHVLLKLSCDKVFEQLTKMEKGKYSHRVTEINKRHRESEKMEPLKKHIREINDKTWSVPSAKDGAIRYTVELVTEECDCSLRCSTCAACVHMYTCSCMDSTLHATVCKHVHIIKMTSSSTSVKKCSPATSHPNKYFTNLLSDKVQATKRDKNYSLKSTRYLC